MNELHRTEVAIPGGSYDVMIGRGALARLGGELRSRTEAIRCALVTDTTVERLFAARVLTSLREAGFAPEVFTMPAGERSKSWAQAGELLEGFSEAGLGRDCVVVALGGGVVGDVAGFAAATYLRGVPVVQVPTTLLAQADSSIGGKTGVDLPRGKNLVGAFWQPLMVLSDTECLAGLPEQEWSSGLAEVVKSAALFGEHAFADLEDDIEGLRVRDSAVVESAVVMAASLKAHVVAGDEREAADRECLNYGHTLAHALERELGYGTITHGAAVADGMRFAAHLAESVLGAPPEWTARQEALLDGLGLTRSGAACDAAGLLAAMRSDKKSREGRVRFVLLRAPGAWTVTPLDDAVLGAALAGWCASTGGNG